MCEKGLRDPFQDQVACARYRAERDMLAQAMERVADDIEHTFLGFEGAEDAPAMRWARDFRAALGSLHAPARDTAMSAHDLLPEEEREAIAWVKEHGGIDDVERFWNCYRTIAGVVGRVETGERCKVVEADSRSVSVDFRVDGDGTKHTGSILPANLTHRAPVLAADGLPLREGETVWHKSGHAHGVVETIDAGSLMHTVRYRGESGELYRDAAKDLTHKRPDSLDRLAEDIDAMVVAWRSNKDLFDAQEAAAGCVGEITLGAALDSLVRRAKALAERDA